MKKYISTMEKVLKHEMRNVNALALSVVHAMPNYSDRKRGPFTVAWWHEKKDDGVSNVVVQVCYRHCLGISTICADGMKFSAGGKRSMGEEEISAYR